MEQMSLFENIDDKEVRKEVVKYLKYYKALRVRVENQEERHATGYTAIFPKLHESSIHDIRFKQIDRTLKYALDDVQRKIIEMKYLGSHEVKDTYVYNELMIHHDPYYEKKGSAIRLIATALEII